MYRAHSQQGPERLELPLLSSEAGRAMQRAYSHEGEVPIVLQPLTSPHGGKSQELHLFLKRLKKLVIYD